MKEKLKPNSMPKANVFSYLTFWWMNDFFRYGSENTLDETDMLELQSEDTSAKICSVLEREWMRELKHSDRKPSLTRAVVRAYWAKCGLFTLLGVANEILRLALPVLVYLLILRLEDPGSAPEWHTYAYAAAITVCTAVKPIGSQVYIYHLQRIGWHLRAAMCALMYKKTLKLSQRSLFKTTTGQIVNLGATDVIRFDFLPFYSLYVWIAPLNCLLAGLVLWNAIGTAALVGVGGVVVLMLVQMFVCKGFGMIRANIAVITDHRVRLMSEVITGMRVIKMYTWEKPFSKLVSEVRRKEIAAILRASALRAFNTTMFICQHKLASFVTLLSFVAMGGILTPSRVFLVLGVFHAIRFVTGAFFPVAFEKIYESLTSIKRIETYLLLDELQEDQEKHQKGPGSQAVILADVTAKWDELLDHETQVEILPALKNVNIEVEKGQLLAVIGPVGSGKSSFLSAILRELPLLRGEVRINGEIALADQMPWVFSDTMRENILFGEAYDKERYERVIKACALTKDLEQIPGGDLALIGERGVTLSGGQKARVNLARAAYRKDASIYLLDDPLSAVDASVANHIFRHCICGIMSSKTRIIVTHQLQLLKDVDQIIILKEGEIVDRGTYDELETKGTDFASLLKQEVTKKSNEPAVQEDGPVRGTRRKSSVMLSNKLNKRNRTYSIQSTTSIGTLSEMEDTPWVMEEEYREQGNIGIKVYLEYLRAASNYVVLLIYLLFDVGNHVTAIFIDWWLSIWSDAVYQISDNSTMVTSTTNFNSTVALPTATTRPEVDTHRYTIIYAALVATMFVVTLIRSVLHYVICVSSAKVMHKKMFASLLRCPIRFFDTNPVGRILNRFSKDMGQIDELLPFVSSEFLHMSGMIVSGIVLTSIVNYFVVVISIPLVVGFVWFRGYFLRTARDIKRLEGTCRSPVFSLLSSTLHGLTTVRAYRMQDNFEEQFHAHQDLHSASWFLFLCARRWLGLRLEMMNAIFVAFVTFVSLLANSFLHLNAAETGLIITYSISLCGLFQYAVIQNAEMENLMTSVERIQQYYRLPMEAPDEVPEKKPPRDWPTSGAVKFENVAFNYFKDGPIVLKDISFDIRSREKVGIVGRTGAGKSSLISALFRLSELARGEIYIDGIPTSTLGLNDLRISFSIIPQDPVLFSGTLKRNLDPFSLCTDDEIWDALEQVQLKELAGFLPKKLNSELAESGSNFSVGQRQLFCLARALLKKSKILIIDEATANVDIRTDLLIQKTIREKFKSCTVLTIAHRLNTIIDSDRILVLDAGSVKEFDTPQALLRIPGGRFWSMVNGTATQELKMPLEISEEIQDEIRHRKNQHTELD